MKVIKDRLTDKCESDPQLVMEYINEDQREDLASIALTMATFSMSSDCYQDAQDRAKSIFESALEDYIDDHHEQERAEYMQEMREEAAEMRHQAQRDEMLEEKYGEALMGAV